MLRITAYAERLISDLEGLDWSPSIKKLQIDWIGRSVGAEVDFNLGTTNTFALWKESRRHSGLPTHNRSMRCAFTPRAPIRSLVPPTW